MINNEYAETKPQRDSIKLTSWGPWTARGPTAVFPGGEGSLRGGDGRPWMKHSLWLEELLLLFFITFL